MAVASRAWARALAMVLLIGLVGCSTAVSTPSPASILSVASPAPTPLLSPSATPPASTAPGLGLTTVEFHRPSQPLVDQLATLGYDCEAGGYDDFLCPYTGSQLDLSAFYGIVIDGQQDLRRVLLFTDDRQRVANWLAAVTDSQTAAWALDRLGVLVTSAEAFRAGGEYHDDGLPSCRTLDTGVLQFAVTFRGQTMLLSADLRAFDLSDPNCQDQPVLQPGAFAVSPCEEAIVAYLETACCGDANRAAFEQLFTTCTRADFEGLNSKLTNDFREDWQEWVDGACADAEHPKTMLCQP